jgi:hypothetical protein
MLRKPQHIQPRKKLRAIAWSEEQGSSHSIAVDAQRERAVAKQRRQPPGCANS